jgi:ech hydrogenase subunit D
MEERGQRRQMFELLQTEHIDKDSLINKAKELSKEGYRFIQLHCVKTLEEMFLIYTFEKIGLELINYRMNVTDGETLPSISSVYSHASLYENETNELFGVEIKGMAIDFKGTFYEMAVPTAFKDVIDPKSKPSKT